MSYCLSLLQDERTNELEYIKDQFKPGCYKTLEPESLRHGPEQAWGLLALRLHHPRLWGLAVGSQLLHLNLPRGTRGLRAAADRVVQSENTHKP